MTDLNEKPNFTNKPNHQLKIAQISPPWVSVPPKNYGGTENVIDALISAQEKQGHKITLFASGTSNVPKGIELISRFDEALYDKLEDWDAHLHANIHYRHAVKYIKNFNKLYPSEKFDIVHIHFSATSDLLIFPLLHDFLPNTPIVATLHSTFPFDHKYKNYPADLLYKDYFKDVPLVAISNKFKEVANAGVSDYIPKGLNFCGVVYNGISTEMYKPSDYKPSDYFIWLGRINSIKGVHLAIEAAKKANKPLILAGGVYEESQIEYFKKMIEPQLDIKLSDGTTRVDFNQEQVEELISKKNKIIFVGSANLEQKINLYKRAQGFVNPIEWDEPFGMVLIEANACGCPVISFERGAIPEIVEDNKTGYLIKDTIANPQKAVNQMAEAMKKISNDVVQGNFTMRKYAREHVLKKFSNEAMANGYNQVYNKVINEKNTKI